MRMAVTARISLSLASAVPSRESGDSACDGLVSGGGGVSVCLSGGFSRSRRRRVGLTSPWGDVGWTAAAAARAAAASAAAARALRASRSTLSALL